MSATTDAWRRYDQGTGPLLSGRRPDAIDAFFAGENDPAAPSCVLCQHRSCDCPPFGTPEFYALLDRRHGRRPR